MQSSFNARSYEAGSPIGQGCDGCMIPLVDIALDTKIYHECGEPLFKFIEAVPYGQTITPRHVDPIGKIETRSGEVLKCPQCGYTKVWEFRLEGKDE